MKRCISSSLNLSNAASGTIYDANEVGLAAGFVAIDDDNAPSPENFSPYNEVISNLFGS